MAVIGLAVAVLGIPISVLISRHYYRRSNKKRGPTFLLETTWSLAQPALTKNVKGLAVSWNGKNVGSEGISQAKIYFWNNGSEAITAGDVLQPYTISLPVTILACWVSKVSREVVQLTLLRDSANKVTLNFALLEPGDGCTLKIVYDGAPETPLEFNGVSLDSPKPTVLAPHYFYSVPKSRRVLHAYGPILGMPLMAALAAVIVVGTMALSINGVSALAHWLLPKTLAGTILHWLSGVAVAGLFLWVIGLNVWPLIRRVGSPYLPPDVKG
jgi:hypothetical protein